MKCRAIYIVISILLLVSSAQAGQRLEKAESALISQDYELAAQLYSEQYSIAPTVETANNLGVALEKLGRYEEAAKRYRESCYIAGKSPLSCSNYARAQSRRILEDVRPWATGVFLFFLLISMLKHICMLGERLMFFLRRHYHLTKVALLSFTSRIYTENGSVQPDGRIHFDSGTIKIRAQISLPEYRDIYPLTFEVRLVQQGGHCVCIKKAEAADPTRKTLSVQTDYSEIPKVMECPGICFFEVVLLNNGRCLKRIESESVPLNRLVGDLELESSSIAASTPEGVFVGETVFTDSEYIAPSFKLRPQNYPVCKYEALSSKIVLWNLDNKDKQDEVSEPVKIAGDSIRGPQVNTPIAGSDISERIGEWEFRFFVEGRQVARSPFVLTTYEAAKNAIKLQEFSVATMTSEGDYFKAGKVVYLPQVNALAPMAKFAVRYPSERLKSKTTVALMENNKIVSAVEGETCWKSTSCSVMPGSFSLSPQPALKCPCEVVAAVLIDDACIASQQIEIRKSPPNCADVQGRLTRTVRSSPEQIDIAAQQVVASAK